MNGKLNARNPNLKHVLVKAWCTEHCLAITTYSREDGHHGRFLIPIDSITAWMQDPRDRAFYSKDCGHILEMWQDDENYRINVHWISMYSDHAFKGIYQTFTLPAEELFNLLMCGGKPITTVYAEHEAHARIDATRAAKTLQKICANRRMRRAFSKAMRDCFRWRDEDVYLYNDGGGSFFFRTETGCPACGGLILHESTVKTPNGNFRKLYYSIHT